MSELIEAAEATDIFADKSRRKSAKERIVTSEEVISRRPEIVIGSWCGKKFRPEKVPRDRVRPDTGGPTRRSARSQIADHPAGGASRLTDGCGRSRPSFTRSNSQGRGSLGEEYG